MRRRRLIALASPFFLLAALLVSTAPAFAALVGQALPYVASYSLFVVGLLVFDRARLFDRATSARHLCGVTNRARLRDAGSR